jgi:protein-S-isoprenylcysteine O-methyltransferase Ste14
MSVKTQNLVRTTLPGWCGLGAFFFSVWLLYHSSGPPYMKAALTIGAIFITMFCVEATLCIRGNFGLIGVPCQRRIDAGRIFFKIIGLIITISCLSSPYWIFPEYYDNFYKPYFQALAVTWPYLAAFFLFCILWEDPRSDGQEDANYWIAYAVFNFKFKLLKNINLKQHILGWLIKIYFLPLMFVYLVNYTFTIFNFDGVFGTYNTFYNIVFFIDTAFVCVGYIFANDLTDTHIRSADPTLLGWVCTLICYEPFWSVVGSNYLSYGSNWGLWLEKYPYLQIIWAILIMLCLFLYVWATISFGSRFSNLTHRGILVCGPYAYLRHPAYIGKLSSFFLMYIPFIGDNFIIIIRNLFCWGLLAGVYYLRAKTEEANLRSIGPEYDIYAKEVDQNWKKILGHIELLYKKSG